MIAVLTARMARRQLLILLMTLFALANGLTGLAPTYHAMLVLRFLSGLPHGAYFGISMLVAASLVRPDQRTQAVGRVMMGLTVATTIGVAGGQLARTGGRLALELRCRRHSRFPDGGPGGALRTARCG